jgi:hypothetical protein
MDTCLFRRTSSFNSNRAPSCKGPLLRSDKLHGQQQVTAASRGRAKVQNDIWRPASSCSKSLVHFADRLRRREPAAHANLHFESIISQSTPALVPAYGQVTGICESRRHSASTRNCSQRQRHCELGTIASWCGRSAPTKSCRNGALWKKKRLCICRAAASDGARAGDANMDEGPSSAGTSCDVDTVGDALLQWKMARMTEGGRSLDWGRYHLQVKHFSRISV